MRKQTLGVLLVVLLGLLASRGGGFAQSLDLPHTFTGAPTDFLLNGSEVTLPFLLIVEGPDGATLITAVVDPCCQWSLDVPVPAGVSQVAFILSEPQDPTVLRGKSNPLPVTPGGRTVLRTLEFFTVTGPSWTAIPDVPGQAGHGQLLAEPPQPTPQQIQDRLAGMNAANPQFLDRNETLVPVAPPAVEATRDLDDEPAAPTVTAGCGERIVNLQPGFNAVGWTGSDVSLDDAAAGYAAPQAPQGAGGLPATFLYDASAQRFQRNDARLPAALNDFGSLAPNSALWINVDDPAGATWTIPIASNSARDVTVHQDWNFAVWTGPDGTPPPVAFQSLGDALLGAFQWDAVAGRMLAYRPAAPAILNTMGPLAYGTALWLQLARPAAWSIPASDLDCTGAAALPTFPTDVGPIAQSLSPADLETAAAASFEIFRNEEVLQGTNTSRIGEPTAANDRNVILYTGNWHAALSLDNGINWSFVDPTANGFPAPSSGGTFCCDQLTWFDNATGMTFWLLQYRSDGSGNNTVRIVVYQNKTDLEDQDYCVYDYTPQTFGAASSRWFDFNNMRTTDNWLYVTSNRYRYISSTSSSHEGGYVWRLELEDFSASCGNVTTQYYYDDDYYGIPLATTGNTAYWGVHSGSGNDALEIGRATDASSSITLYTRSISAFPSSNSGDFVCTAPDGTNPCGRFGRRLLTAWTSNQQLGFMWDAAQDASAGWPMPHTRVAIFRTSDMTLTAQPHIWNSSYAWVMPTVGVNSRGDIAGPIYVMGGGNYPKAKAFIWDSDSGTPAPWENHTLRSGNDAPDGKGTGDEANGRFGDYGGSIAYDNCRSTWLVAFYTMRDGGTDNDAEHRAAWIGRERDACADLTVSALAFAAIADSSPRQLLIAESTQNIGGGSAGSSTTRYYLSRNRSQSDDDVLLDAIHPVPTLGALDSDGQLELATVPSGTGPGDYYLIACADDFAVVDEITVTNNCLASESQVTISLQLIVIGPIFIPFLPGP